MPECVYEPAKTKAAKEKEEIMKFGKTLSFEQERKVNVIDDHIERIPKSNLTKRV